RARRDDDRRAVVVDLDPLDAPLADERLDVRPHLTPPAPEAAVLGDPRLGGPAPSLHRAQPAPPVELAVRRPPRGQRRARDHALGQLVQALEALAAGDRDLARGEQVLERALRGLPAPHGSAPALERARRQRSLVPQPPEHVALDGTALRGALAAPPVAVA